MHIGVMTHKWNYSMRCTSYPMIREVNPYLRRMSEEGHTFTLLFPRIPVNQCEHWELAQSLPVGSFRNSVMAQFHEEYSNGLVPMRPNDPLPELDLLFVMVMSHDDTFTAREMDQVLDTLKFYIDRGTRLWWWETDNDTVVDCRGNPFLYAFTINDRPLIAHCERVFNTSSVKHYGKQDSFLPQVYDRIEEITIDRNKTVDFVFSGTSFGRRRHMKPWIEHVKSKGLTTFTPSEGFYGNFRQYKTYLSGALTTIHSPSNGTDVYTGVGEYHVYRLCEALYAGTAVCTVPYVDSERTPTIPVVRDAAQLVDWIASLKRMSSSKYRAYVNAQRKDFHRAWNADEWYSTHLKRFMKKKGK